MPGRQGHFGFYEGDCSGGGSWQAEILSSRATTPRGKLESEQDWIVQRTLIRKGVSIGVCRDAVECHRRRHAIVGAGSVVTKDVSADAIVAGSPARVLRSINKQQNGVGHE